MTSLLSGNNDNQPIYYTGISDGIEDVKGFMRASKQDVDAKTASLYLKLIAEEFNELSAAAEMGDRVEVLDGICDLIWVAIGLGIAMDLPMTAAWAEVRRSNYDKISANGFCKFRPDGKVLKPATWIAPRIEELLKEWDDLNANT